MNLLEFCREKNISYRQLSRIAGGTANGASKSTIENLLKGKLEKKKANSVRTILGKKLPDYLLSSGMPPLEINDYLSRIFTEGEFTKIMMERVILTADAQNWFGLKHDPFGINLRGFGDVFISPEHQEMMDIVKDAIRYQGFVAVTGDIGSGKTVFRAWLQEVVQTSHDLELIFPETFDMNKVSAASISRAILEHFDYGKIPIDSVSRAKAVKDLLAAQTGKKVAIAFDECHRLNLTTLSSLKNFLEMSSGGFQRYLGVVLFGQPIFSKQLTKSREIAERLTVLDMPDFANYALDYLTHRLKLVGGNIDELFDEDAIQLIINNAITPLQLGNLVNKCLLITMSEEFEQQRVLGAILRASKDLHLPNKTKRKLHAVG